MFIVHMMCKLTSKWLQQAAKVFTPFAFYDSSSLHYYSVQCPINNHTQLCILTTCSHLSFTSEVLEKKISCLVGKRETQGWSGNQQAINLEWPQCHNLFMFHLVWRHIQVMIVCLLWYFLNNKCEHGPAKVHTGVGTRNRQFTLHGLVGYSSPNIV